MTAIDTSGKADIFHRNGRRFRAETVELQPGQVFAFARRVGAWEDPEPRRYLWPAAEVTVRWDS